MPVTRLAHFAASPCLALALGTTDLPAQCRKHIELVSAREVAAEAGTTEEWVVRNYRVNIWARPTPQGKGRKVGAMLPGSRAVILEEGPEDYRVRSPLDQSVGWVSKIQVKRTLYQDVETREPCTP